MTDTKRAALNAWLAERLFGQNLVPSPELAMARVIWRHTQTAGQPFVVRLPDGSTREVTLPSGDTIRECQPPDSLEWNDRYAAYVGQQLRDVFWAEADAYRLEPQDYAGTWDGAGLVISAMRGRGWHLMFQAGLPGGEYLAEYEPIGREEPSVEAYDQDGPQAIARAAARALGWEPDRA